MNTPPPWLGISTGDWLINSNTPHMDAIESSTDPLTGALNRRGLHLNIGDLLNQATSREDAVVVIVVDIDRFKQINDTFGHAVGDKVLV